MNHSLTSGYQLESTNYIQFVWSQFKIKMHFVYHIIQSNKVKQIVDELLYMKNYSDIERVQFMIEFLRLEFPLYYNFTIIYNFA